MQHTPVMDKPDIVDGLGDIVMEEEEQSIHASKDASPAPGAATLEEPQLTSNSASDANLESDAAKDQGPDCLFVGNEKPVSKKVVDIQQVNIVLYVVAYKARHHHGSWR